VSCCGLSGWEGCCCGHSGRLAQVRCRVLSCWGSQWGAFKVRGWGAHLGLQLQGGGVCEFARLAVDFIVAICGHRSLTSCSRSSHTCCTNVCTCLTACVQAPDGRRMTNMDYINDTCKQARVAVTGRINGVSEAAASAVTASSGRCCAVPGVTLCRVLRCLVCVLIFVHFTSKKLAIRSTHVVRSCLSWSIPPVRPNRKVMFTCLHTGAL
jgi:hypothetical protein